MTNQRFVQSLLVANKGYLLDKTIHSDGFVQFCISFKYDTGDMLLGLLSSFGYNRYGSSCIQLHFHLFVFNLKSQWIGSVAGSENLNMWIVSFPESIWLPNS